jgi:membrane protease YdiL (CAAX protease family)
VKPWGIFATFILGAVALLGGQIAGVAAIAWYAGGLNVLPVFNSDGLAVALLILISTPVQVALLALFARHGGGSVAEYLGLIWPRRSEVIIGIAGAVAFIVGGNALTWVFGRNIVTDFQVDIYRTASPTGWLPLLLFAVIVVTPIGEETLFRGFLFRGWLRLPSKPWLAIAATALLWAIIHVQYDWFIISQVFVSGLLLGWLRWASGSTILTMLLHGLINAEGMLETFISLNS